MKPPLVQLTRLLRVLVVAVLGALSLQALGPVPAASAFPSLQLPFREGEAWYVCQGYNGRPSHSGSISLDVTTHPTSGPDGCWGGENAAANKPVFAPASGSLAQVSAAFGGVCITFDDGTSMYLGHLLNLRANGRVNAGEQIGTVAPAGQVNNGNYAHVHLQAHNGRGCGSSPKVAFAGAARFQCNPEMPSNGTVNQWRTTRLVRCGSSTPPPVNQYHLKEPQAAGCTADARTIATRPFSGMTLQVRYSAKCGTNWLRVEGMRGTVNFYIKSDMYSSAVDGTQTGSGGIHWSNQVHAPGSTCINFEAKSLSTGQGTGRQRLC